jgi:hypothetical protein
MLEQPHLRGATRVLSDEPVTGPAQIEKVAYVVHTASRAGLDVMDLGGSADADRRDAPFTLAARSCPDKQLCLAQLGRIGDLRSQRCFPLERATFHRLPPKYRSMLRSFSRSGEKSFFRSISR